MNTFLNCSCNRSRVASRGRADGPRSSSVSSTIGTPSRVATRRSGGPAAVPAGSVHPYTETTRASDRATLRALQKLITILRIVRRLVYRGTAQGRGSGRKQSAECAPASRPLRIGWTRTLAVPDSHGNEGDMDRADSSPARQPRATIAYRLVRAVIR